MDISFNLPYVTNGPSPGPEDAYVLTALEKPILRIGKFYLPNRPKVAPYQQGPIGGRIATFNIYNAFTRTSSPLNNAIVLEALMGGLINANKAYLRFHDYAPLYDAGVRYDRTQIWDTIPALYARGYGDCKSLTGALVAERRKNGQGARAVFRWIERKDDPGIRDFHILVDTEYGYEDPSKVLGMGSNENAHFRKG